MLFPFHFSLSMTHQPGNAGILLGGLIRSASDFLPMYGHFYISDYSWTRSWCQDERLSTPEYSCDPNAMVHARENPAKVFRFPRN
jgi:hypothetical protein